MNSRNFTLVILVFGFTFFSLSVAGQMTKSEKQLLHQTDFHQHKFDPRRPQFLKIGNNAITRYNPVSLVFASSLYVYQKLISPQLQSHCPYVVSCSAFSKASIEHFGLIKGLVLTVDRLSRCTEFSSIDLRPSQFDSKTGYIKDPLYKYEHRSHKH